MTFIVIITKYHYFVYHINNGLIVNDHYTFKFGNFNMIL